jgi:hypothetical protein
MILRHYTRKEYLPSILRDGYLKAKDKPGKRDHNTVSFEEYMGNDFILRGFLKDKHWSEEEVIPLFFDGKMAKEEGVPFKDIGYTKAENLIFIDTGDIDEEQYAQIGEYFFVEGNLPLHYLTDKSKKEIGYTKS